MSANKAYSSFIDSLCKAICHESKEKSDKLKIILNTKYPYLEPMLSHEETATRIGRDGFKYNTIEQSIRKICETLPIVKSSPKNEINLKYWLETAFSQFLYEESQNNLDIFDPSEEEGIEYMKGIDRVSELSRKRLFGSEQIKAVRLWVGRDELLAELKQELVNGKRVIAIVGQGGMGKTSLAIKSIESMGVDLVAQTLTAECPYEYVLFHTVRKDEGFDTVAAALLAVVAPEVGASAVPQETIDRIIAGLNKYRCLVVLDNLESLLRGEGSGQSIEPDLDDLLNRLVDGGHRSQIIITSRELTKGLADRRGTRVDPKFVKEIIIPGISVDASIELLRQLGLTDSEADLAWIADRVGGNALILTFLADIGQEQPGYLRQNPDLVCEEATPVIGAQFARQSGEGRELLRRMCVLRIGTNAEHLATLRSIEGDDEVVAATKEQVGKTKALLATLKGCGLVESIYDPVVCQPFYTLHRLVGDVLINRFQADLPNLYCYAVRFYSSFESPQEYHCIEDWIIDLERLHFQWLLGMYVDVCNIAIHTLLPQLKQWGYWSLQKDWCERVIPYTKDTDYLLCLQMLGCIFRETAELDKAETKFQLSLKQSEKLSNKAGVAISLSLIASVKRKQGKLEEADYFYDRSLNAWREIENYQGVADVQFRRAYIEYQRGEWDNAELLYRKSLSLQGRLRDHPGMSVSWGILADIQCDRGDNLDLALHLSKKSLKLREKIADREGIAIALRVTGDIQRKRGEWDSANDMYNQALEILTDIGAHARIARVIGCLGKNALEQEQFDVAEVFLNDALKQMKSLKKIDGIAEANWDLAKLYRAKNSPSQAQLHFDRAHQLYTQLGAKADLERIDREWNIET